MEKIGYIRLSRRFFDTEEWAQARTFSRAEAWLDMIAMASYTTRQVSLDDKGREITLYRGEIAASQRYLATRWGWGLGSVNRYLKSLASGNDPRIKIARRRITLELGDGTQSGTPNGTPSGTLVDVITLCKYDVYNSTAVELGTECGTPSGTPNGTNIIKDIEEGNINTHTQFLYFLKIFSRACKCASAEALAQTREAVEFLSTCDPTEEEVAEWERLDWPTRNMFWLWRNYGSLQQCFDAPLIYWQMRALMKSYETEDIERIIDQMANKQARLSTKSFYSTFKTWAERDFRIQKKAALGNPKYSAMM